MTDKRFLNFVKHAVSDYQAKVGQPVDPEDVFIVWSCKTIQNFKALAGTPIQGDGRYYEITYNGDKDEVYFDAYKKELHVAMEGSRYDV